MVEVVHYVTENGSDPFGEWLSKQDVNVIARVQQRIDRVHRGNFGNHKRLEGGIAELRIDYGPGYRLYYGKDGRDRVVLLAGGAKKRQSRDIDQARSLWRTYKQERRNANKAP